MTTWQQQYPGQGAPPPAGITVPTGGGYASAYPPQPGFPQQGYPPPRYGWCVNQSFGGPPGFVPTPQFPMPSGGYENADYPTVGFTDQNVRRSFIRKVYSFLLGCITAAVWLALNLFAFQMKKNGRGERKKISFKFKKFISRHAAKLAGKKF